VKRAGQLLLATVLLAGCMAGLKVESNDEALAGHDAMPRDVTAGARLGLVDGRVSVINEDYLIKAFILKLNDAGLFRNVNYPITGKERVIFEIGGDSSVHGPGQAAEVTKVFVCSLTLLIVCVPMSEEYEFRLDVRAIYWPSGPEINRYHATGKSRVRYGITSREDSARSEAERAAMTAAYDRIINQLIKDRPKYLSGPPQGPVGP
jgi:hypothetical protein